MFCGGSISNGELNTCPYKADGIECHGFCNWLLNNRNDKNTANVYYSRLCATEECEQTSAATLLLSNIARTKQHGDFPKHQMFVCLAFGATVPADAPHWLREVCAELCQFCEEILGPPPIDASQSEIAQSKCVLYFMLCDEQTSAVIQHSAGNFRYEPDRPKYDLVYDPDSPSYEPYRPYNDPHSPSYVPYSPSYEPVSPSYEPVSPIDEP